MENNYFEIPDEIFEIGLGKHEILVYTYFCYCLQEKGIIINLTNREIANKLNITESTVCWSIKELTFKKLVVKIGNEYKLYLPSGEEFKVGGGE